MGYTIKILAIACLSLFASSAIAQLQETLKIEKATVSVISLTGHVNFVLDDPLKPISFPNKSFVSIRIGDEIFSNNDNSPKGVTLLSSPTMTKSADKITATWNVASVKIEQIVEPRLDVNSNLVPAVRYYVTNNSTTTVEVQPQYLIDVKIGRSDGGQYRLPGASFASEWTRHTTSIPSSAIFSENHWEPPVFDAGILAELKFDDLMFSRPSMLLIGAWDKLEVMPFVDPSLTLPVDDIRDVGVIMQWSSAIVSPGETQEIAIFSYGPNITPSSVNVNEEADLRMWPNPVSDALHIVTDARLQGRIQNVIGQTVWNGILEGESSIDVRSLEPGSYFLSVGQRVHPIVIVR